MWNVFSSYDIIFNIFESISQFIFLYGHKYFIYPFISCIAFVFNISLWNLVSIAIPIIFFILRIEFPSYLNPYTNFQDCSGQSIIQYIVGFVSLFDGLANYFPMVLIWMQLFKQIKTFICEFLKENLVIQLIVDFKMRYSSSDHDKKTKHTYTNTHLAPTQFLHLNNVGSFHGLTNDILIVFYYCFMVMRCH